MSRNRRKKKIIKPFFSSIVVLFFLLISAIYGKDIVGILEKENLENTNTTISTYANIAEIPDYAGEIYVTLNNNLPNFEESSYPTKSFEKYGDLDALGRCTVAFANLSSDTMPKDGEERESISNVKPTGWKQAKYDGEYLYNRCHLIGYQLSNENANEKNLITGTRYFNVEGMLPFENQVAEYLHKNPQNHVLYRVTPVFEGNNMLAKGVEMEAYSVEDKGEGICFHVFVYNVQPGVEIDYATGESTKK